MFFFTDQKGFFRSFRLQPVTKSVIQRNEIEIGMHGRIASCR